MSALTTVIDHDTLLECIRNRIKCFRVKPEYHDLAIAFLNRLTEVVSIPLDIWCVDREDTGCSHEGKISFYWDANDFYVDMEMNEEANSFSLFSRNRATNEDNWIEHIFLQDLTDEWFFKNMKPLIG